MKNKKLMIIVSIILIVIIIGISLFLVLSKDNSSDAVKFSKEYETVTDNNVFVYRTDEEIIKILKNGTGIVYLGFPECPWCREYVKYLNEVALANDYEKIYYKNILDERKNNTDFYQELIKILDEYLQYDDEGNKRIYVPAVIAVKKGKIVGFDDETSLDTKGYETPQDYWQNEDLAGLKEKLRQMMSDTIIDSCTSDCNK